MHQIDDNFLASLGLAQLPQDEKEKMKAHIYETLEMRVGIKLASNMTDEQLTEFETLMNNQDDAGALRWLETNFPNYKQVVTDELNKLKEEIKQMAPQILSHSETDQPPQQPAN